MKKSSNPARCCFLLLCTLATEHAVACGNGTTTVTNLPSLGGSSLFAYGLNASGQITGYSYISGDQGYDAFIYGGGNPTDLGTLGGPTSIGYSINDLGQVAGQADLPDYSYHAVVSAAGSLVDLGTLGGSFSSATAINAAGQVVGSSTLSNDVVTSAFLYTNGTMTNLGTLGGDYSSAAAINRAGIIVGLSTVANGNFHAFIYTNGTMGDLGTLGDDYSSALAINDAGVIAGESSTNNETHGFVVSGGVMTDIGTLGGSYSTAYLINSNNQVVGLSTTTNEAATHGFIYSGGTMTDLGDLGGGYSAPKAVNNLGVVVGMSLTSGLTYHAFIYQNGQMADLNDLLPTNSGWELSSAQLINDSGRIVGYGLYFGQLEWFVLDLPGGNQPPVAVAGPDQVVDCASQVTLDGSQSSDPDSDPLAYEWSVAGTVLGTNVSIATSLPLGTNVVTLKVTDPCGASSQANLIVVVVDTTAPSILSAPAPITLSAGPNCQAAVPNVLSNVIAVDNCTPANLFVLTQNPTAGTIVGTGSYTIAIAVADASGNTANTNVSLSVVDATAPTLLSTPAPITISAGSDCQAVVPNVLSGVTATDNCTPANQLVLTQSPTAGSTVGTGQYTITVTAADAAGNTSTGSVSLTVVDTTPPTIISAPGPITLSAGANCQVAVPNVLSNIVASDNCTPTNQLVMSQNPVAGTIVGTGQYTISVTVADVAGNASSTNVSLTVVDTTAPTIVSTPAPITISVGANCQASVPNVLANIVATDNCTPANELALSQSPAAGTTVGTGQYAITVKVTDAAGNSTTSSVSLTVADTTPPSIVSVPAPVTISSGPNCQASVPNVLANVVATDNCTPANQLALSQSPAAGTTVSTGQYGITITVTDAAGNSSTGNVSLTVVDTTAPSILSLPAPISIQATNCQGIVPNVLTNVVASDNCTPAGQLVKTQTPAAGTVVGTGPHPITVTVSDAAGNTSTGTVSFSVVENVPPVIVSAPNNITVSATKSGQASVPNVLPSVVATDNCTPSNQLVLAQSPLAGTLVPRGHYKITLTVTDLSGNSSSTNVNLKVK